MAVSVSNVIDLHAQGWRQGSLFSAPQLALASLTLKPNVQDRKAVSASRTVKASERLVVVSQDCDIKSEDELNVEAFVCEQQRNIRDLRFWGQIRTAFNSRRYFAFSENWLVKATHRLTLHKSLLEDIQPEPWTDTPERLVQFTQWLGARYTQPAIPDDVVDGLQKPIADALAEWFQQEPDAVRALTKAVGELRLALPKNEEPPYVLTPLLVMTGNELTTAEADALDKFMNIVMTKPDPAVVRINYVDPRTEHEILVSEWKGTSPLYYERYTYEGNDLIGMPPLRAS